MDDENGVIILKELGKALLTSNTDYRLAPCILYLDGELLVAPPGGKDRTIGSLI